MARDWNIIVAAFAERNGLDEAARAALRRFVDEQVLGHVITVDPDAWSTLAATQDDTTSSSAPLGPAEAATVLRDSGALDVVDDGEVITQPRHLPTEENRYIDLGLVGVGGMGEVRRVRDMALNRTMAMKVMRPELIGKPAAEARFIAEAQATAQLQHPGVVPVHDLGRLPDGRWYFTMKELRGYTLHQVLGEAEARPERWPRRRLLEVFRSVAETVAYSHARGAVHRDLKPANILVGDFGEVVVLDWGLVKAVGVVDAGDDAPMAVDSFATRAGAILGTPAYMAPEQARGAVDVGPPADIYALGALLYEILAGRPPFAGEPEDVLDQVRHGRPDPLPDAVPEELARLCERSMAIEVGARPSSATELVEQLNHYLDGAARRARALEIIRQADALQPLVEGHLERAEALRHEARELARNTADWAHVEEKRPIWTREDEAAEIQRRADLVGLHRLQLLRAALTEVPDLTEAKERLAYVYHWCHQRAERVGNLQEVAQYELLLQEYDTGAYADYLRGDGTVTLYTEPQARASLYRYERVDRRLVARWDRDLGTTPLVGLRLPMGSWVVRLESPQHAPVHYPVFVGRGLAWEGVPPGQRHPRTISLPKELGPDEIYVPAGWALLGGNRADGVPPEPCWVDGFVIQRFQVTNEQYIAFLDDLVMNGRSAEAASHLPRTGAGSPAFWQDEHGRHHLGLDDDGDAWQPDHPVSCVTLASARAYASWYSARRGQPWRLPWADEWEKAARGVDGRRYPMGPHLDPTWANVRGCHPHMVLLTGVHAFPDDLSPYGVRGMTGGVMDLCHDRWAHARVDLQGGRAVRVEADEKHFLVAKGGWRTAEVERCRAAIHVRVAPDIRLDALGFRLVRPVVDPEPKRGVAYRLAYR